MELYKEILIEALSRSQLEISISNLEIDVKQIVESRCYNALQKIKAIIEDDSLEDADCFNKIEEIILILEEIGSSGGTRHDFG